MKRFSRFIVLGAALALLVALVVPVTAQDYEGMGPGEGGVVIEATSGGDPSTFNPLLGSDTVSSNIYGRMYPSIVAIDPATLDEQPMVAGGMAASWEYDETGTVVTITLRDDIFWSDGTPITADDYIWAADAVRSGETSSPRTSAFFELADGTVQGGGVISYEKIDDYTIQFVVGDPVRDEEGNVIRNEDGSVAEVTPNCVAFSDINDVTPVPAHIYDAAFGDDYASMDADPFFVPAGTFGIFTDPFFEAGVQVSMLADQTYPDTVLGYVSPEEYVVLQVPDTTVEFERFLAGELTTIAVPGERQNELRNDERFQIFEYSQNGYTYMGYNTADPENPVDGYDADGNLQEQGLHPIFGDVRVRRALAYAVDTAAIVGTPPNEETGEPATGILEGNGYRGVTHNSLISWVDPELEPYPFEPETALSLLAEAGWSDQDGDGTLECNGCLYAQEVDPSFEGTPFQFELLTNAGNLARERTGQTIRDQLGEIGIVVDFQAIDFGTLVDVLLSQTFDAIIIGWSLGLPFDPDGRWAFSADGDRVGAGFAMTSYHNQELYDLWEEATTIPGCDREARLDLYRQAMRILYDEQPYMWLYASNVMVAAQANVGNFDPLPLNTQWNIDAWTVLADE